MCPTCLSIPVGSRSVLRILSLLSQNIPIGLELLEIRIRIVTIFGIQKFSLNFDPKDFVEGGFLLVGFLSESFIFHEGLYLHLLCLLLFLVCIFYILYLPLLRYLYASSSYSHPFFVFSAPPLRCSYASLNVPVLGLPPHFFASYLTLFAIWINSQHCKLCTKSLQSPARKSKGIEEQMFSQYNVQRWL